MILVIIDAPTLPLQCPCLDVVQDTTYYTLSPQEYICMIRRNPALDFPVAVIRPWSRSSRMDDLACSPTFRFSGYLCEMLEVGFEVAKTSCKLGDATYKPTHNKC